MSKVLTTIDAMMRGMTRDDLVATVQHAAIHYNGKGLGTKLTWEVQSPQAAPVQSALTQAGAETTARRGGPGTGPRW